MIVLYKIHESCTNQYLQIVALNQGKNKEITYIQKTCFQKINKKRKINNKNRHWLSDLNTNCHGGETLTEGGGCKQLIILCVMLTSAYLQHFNFTCRVLHRLIQTSYSTRLKSSNLNLNYYY